MILRIEERRSSGDASPGKSAVHGSETTPHEAKERNLARTNLAAIEMAVVMIVVALVTVSIILTTGCSNRQPQDLGAARTSAPAGLSRSAVATTPSEQRLEDAKRNARETDVSDLSVGS